MSTDCVVMLVFKSVYPDSKVHGANVGPTWDLRTDLVIYNESCEFIFIEIEKEIFQQSKNIIIAVIYRPPGTDLKAFNNDMDGLLNVLKKKIFFT